jgi:hypothetical protein
MLLRIRGRVFCRFRKCSYHVVFDKPIDWPTNTKIRAWLAIESQNPSLQKYALMQGIKKTSLRISEKENKPVPKVVFRFGTQNKMIKKYLETRSFILSFLLTVFGLDKTLPQPTNQLPLSDDHSLIT